MRRSEAGFTALELTLAATIIALLAAIFLGRALEVRERANRVDCDVYRDLVEEGEVAFNVRRQRPSDDPRELVSEGILGSMHACRSGGHYEWVPFPPEDARFHRHYGCSVHDWPGAWGDLKALRPPRLGKT